MDGSIKAFILISKVSGKFTFLNLCCVCTLGADVCGSCHGSTSEDSLEDATFIHHNFTQLAQNTAMLQKAATLRTIS